MGSEQSVMATPLPDFQPPQDAQDVSDAVFSDNIHEDSFLSCKSFMSGNGSGSQMVLDRSVSPDVQFCNLVNFANLRTSVANESMCDHLQSNSLYDLLNSHRVSCNYQGCVTACAAFIISYLKFSGKVIPFGTSLLNRKTTAMIKVLKKLNNILGEIKTVNQQNQHINNLSNEKQCVDCKSRELLLQQINLFNLSAHETFCVVCLTTVPEKDESSHNSSELHSKIKDLLQTQIYPFACSYCSARFNKICDLQLHMERHETSESLAETVFPFFCCYLCKTAYENEIDLMKHNMLSVEHACKRELAMEVALRLKIVKDTQTVLNPPQNDDSIQKETKPMQVGSPMDGTKLSVSSESTLNYSSSPHTDTEVDSMNWPVSAQYREESVSAQSETAFDIKKKSLEVCDMDSNTTYSVPISTNCQDICAEASSSSVPVNVFQNILCLKNVVKESERNSDFQQSKTTILSLSHHSDLPAFQVASSSQTLGLEVDRCESPEFEAECGSCGGLFKIYNNDVKLSMDIHIQSDAQHSLAVDTPNFAVVETITSTPNPSSAVGYSPTNVPIIEEEVKQATVKLATVKDSLKNNVVQCRLSSWILTNDHNLAQFILEEVKCLKYLKRHLVCEICDVKVPFGDSQLNHVWGEPHLKNLFTYQSISVWRKKLTMISRWEKHVLKTELGDRNLRALNQYLYCVKKYKQMLHLKLRSTEYKCEVCEISVSISDRAIHENGTDHKHNLLSYVCQVCDVPVSRGNKNQHEAGKKHCNNLKVVQENEPKQTDQPYLEYYCSLCNRRMHINDKMTHKNGSSHQKMKEIEKLN